MNFEAMNFGTSTSNTRVNVTLHGTERDGASVTFYAKLYKEDLGDKDIMTLTQADAAKLAAQKLIKELTAFVGEATASA